MKKAGAFFKKKFGHKISLKTKDQARQEYWQLCARLGEQQYKIKVLNEDIDVLVEDLKRVNKEFVTATEENTTTTTEGENNGRKETETQVANT